MLFPPRIWTSEGFSEKEEDPKLANERFACTGTPPATDEASSCLAAGASACTQVRSSGVTVYVSAGSISCVLKMQSHYVENTGDADMVFLKVLQAPRFSDIRVSQWLRLTPRQIVQDTLRLPDSVPDSLSPDKQYVVQSKNFIG